eukprot:CAMPEP_0204843194 /NCGR_PEP_ID=MMETSP1346-20131115/47839_1 /ASSEMBLY_ACC=CAM_ASM_000771 /TAXON_ID=215587 /ORGANISM="Aplanochytrium stocchinoi, Strain GSBS06" /LENGTH=276 /DNA_ID=CAMNT_0051982299 /DNA_START=186 /DNA_END=1016 /DNA_ORIENTATION=-
MLLSSSSSSFGLMNVVEHRATQKAHPFGDERTVDQAFPGAIHEKDADPFLMCDDFSMKSKGAEKDPDRFPVDWHPHRGIDVLTYLKSGIGRHGDSLGNRETYKTPGMQWMSTSSGVYHAEGGGTPKGVDNDGFQIWVNVPASGDERTVDQAFPGAIHEKDADPFLMCDDFSMKSKGAEKDPDRFPVDWHPHRGIDVLTYLKSGIGRHGDSLGNRETYKTPGMQWMSTGSGVYHAEGGGTPKGVDNDGFQIWVNVPASKKTEGSSIWNSATRKAAFG